MTLSIPEPAGLMEAADLAALEAVIERGQQTFAEVGQALLAIRDGRGYLIAGYHTFEDYCRERWGLKRQTAYDQMHAAEVMANVRTSVQTLPTAAQAVELSRLEPEQQREIAESTDFLNTSVRELREKVREVKPVAYRPRTEAPKPEPEPEDDSFDQTTETVEVTTVLGEWDEGEPIVLHAEVEEPTPLPRYTEDRTVYVRAAEPTPLPDLPTRLSDAEKAYFGLSKMMLWVHLDPKDVAQAANPDSLDATIDNYRSMTAWLTSLTAAVEARRDAAPVRLLGGSRDRRGA